jgi:hypothetical protein
MIGAKKITAKTISSPDPLKHKAEPLKYSLKAPNTIQSKIQIPMAFR